MPTADAWDWPLLLYAGVVILKMSERQFWRTTPRKLFALLRVHADLNSVETAKARKAKRGRNTPSNWGNFGYIDQIF